MGLVDKGQQLTWTTHRYRLQCGCHCERSISGQSGRRQRKRTDRGGGGEVAALALRELAAGDQLQVPKQERRIPNAQAARQQLQVLDFEMRHVGKAIGATAAPNRLQLPNNATILLMAATIPQSNFTCIGWILYSMILYSLALASLSSLFLFAFEGFMYRWKFTGNISITHFKEIGWMDFLYFFCSSLFAFIYLSFIFVFILSSCV